MYMIVRDDIKVYKTIHDEDKDNFFRVASLHPDNKFQLVTQKDKIKEILLNNFASKSRGGDYTSGLPSATVISSGLFPMCLDENKSGNSIGLLNWFNNQTVEDYEKQQLENKKSLDAGNFIHVVLELAFTHDVRNFERERGLEQYIEWAGYSNELKKQIYNFEEKLPLLKEKARLTLDKFFENDIRRVEPIMNEIFIKLPRWQGAIDLVCRVDKKLCILDFKTSKKSKSRQQLIDSGYTRQLQIYSDFLLEHGIISKSEHSELIYKILFMNWTSNRYKIEDFSKEEVQYWKMYNNYILDWFHEMVA